MKRTGTMDAKILFGIQMSCLIIMLGTAEGVFISKAHTILFAIALFLFGRCSIYICKNKKRLMKDEMEYQDSKPK